MVEIALTIETSPAGQRLRGQVPGQIFIVNEIGK